METRGSTSAAFPETPLLYLIPLPLKTLCSNTHKPNTHTHTTLGIQQPQEVMWKNWRYDENWKL